MGSFDNKYELIVVILVIGTFLIVVAWSAVNTLVNFDSEYKYPSGHSFCEHGNDGKHYFNEIHYCELPTGEICEIWQRIGVRGFELRKCFYEQT